ncbi:SDR family oxidoreductase [Photobacterium damselae]|uniref:SDR family oxidoreductase n=1 Tax=Photobacterium damselae TaxID=38293 RepID=UPI0011D03E9C|nr:SDR family oxidoreductase [Photobacterium damselae]KAB1508395.1 SDR family oxidoreductase [Photobacterium damselae subsp. damselae]
MTGKVYLVTGGASGIGRGICLYLAKKNATVIALDINEDAGFELVSQEPRIRFRQADVTSESDIQAVITDIEKNFGRLDGLVNNAAISDPYNAPLSELAMADWQRVLNVNLTAPLYISQQCLPLLKQSYGSIIHLSSTRASQSEPNTEAYSATKGAIVALTHSMAMSLGPDIRVNCISPGWINASHSELREIDHQQHPVGRVGVVDDIAAMVSFLLSEESGFITGQNFTIDGGMTKKMIYSE